MKHGYNTKYLRQRPHDVLAQALNCERWSNLDSETRSLFNESSCVNSSYANLYNKVIEHSKSDQDFLWSEFLTIAYALRGFALADSNPLVIKEKHRFYVVASESTAFSISEKRHLSECEHRTLMMNEFTAHYSLEAFIKEFYEEVAKLHRSKKDFSALKKTQSFIINFDPRDIDWLARRGLTNKDLHCYTEALNDLKKYVFMTDGKNCSSMVKSALLDLQGLKALDTLKTANSKH